MARNDMDWALGKIKADLRVWVVKHKHHQLCEAIKAQLPLLSEDQLKYFHAALSQAIKDGHVHRFGEQSVMD